MLWLASRPMKCLSRWRKPFSSLTARVPSFHFIRSQRSSEPGSPRISPAVAAPDSTSRMRIGTRRSSMRFLRRSRRICFHSTGWLPACGRNAVAHSLQCRCGPLPRLNGGAGRRPPATSSLTACRSRPSRPRSPSSSGFWPGMPLRRTNASAIRAGDRKSR